VLAFVLMLCFARPAFPAPSDAATQAADRLRAVAGTDETVTFWSGDTAERPDYTWTFNGRDISKAQAASLTSLDLDIVLSAEDADGSGTPDTLILAFSYEGELPLPARISVAVPDNFDANRLSLFAFDEQNGTFDREMDGLVVQDGYVTFSAMRMHTRALSSADLTTQAGAIPPMPLSSESSDSGEPEPASTPETASASIIEPDSPLASAFSPPAPLLIALGLVVVCVLAAILIVRYRRRAAIAAMQEGWQASEVAFEDIPSLDELIEVEEPSRD
jgi:hypothetical protein